MVLKSIENTVNGGKEDIGASEGRTISSPGFFVAGYGVTPERADAQKIKSLLMELVKLA